MVYRALAPGEQGISLGPDQSRQKGPLTEQVQGPVRGTEGSEHQPGAKPVPLSGLGVQGQKVRPGTVRSELWYCSRQGAVRPASQALPCASRPHPALPLVKANRDPEQWSPRR